MPANLLECQGGNSEDGTFVKTHSVLNKSLHFTNLDPNYIWQTYTRLLAITDKARLYMLPRKQFV